MAINIRKIQVFVAVAEESSFTRAAKRLRVAQPWLSVQLRQLEEFLGFPLIVRKGERRFGLSAHGKELFPFAKRLSDAFDEMMKVIDIAHMRELRSLTVGASSSTLYLPERNRLICEFVTLHSEIDFSIVHGTPQQLFEKLEEGEVDVVLTALPAPDTANDVVTLSRCKIALAMPREHRLANLLSIDLKQMQGERVVFGSDHYHPPLTTKVIQFLSQYNFELVRVPEEGVEAKLRFGQMLRLPALMLDFPKQFCELPEGMVLRPITGLPFYVEFGLVRKSGVATTALGAFWDLGTAIAKSNDFGRRNDRIADAYET